MSVDTGHAFSTSDRPSVGPFELERSLGRGGMAETFVAVRHGPAGFQQRVCLKRILPELARDPNIVRMFLDEARNTASLRHSNIVQVIDFGTADDQHYLALELVDGLDLHRLLGALPAEQSGLSSEQVTHIAVELSAALDYAHNAPNLVGQRGIFHRDLSPSNILVGESGDLKLTDFGVAKAAGQARATAAGVVRGKVEYMAPEYGMGGEYDARCDQYSLGVLLFEVLTGARPYQGDSQGEVLHRARQGFHRPLITLRPDAPAQLVDTINRMIRPKPEQRFDSMAEVTKALLDIAPGPRGRASLAQLVVRARQQPNDASTTDRATLDPLAHTMVSTVSTPARVAPNSSSPPRSATSDRPLSTASVPIVPVRRFNLRVVWAVALLCCGLIYFGVRALLRDSSPPVPPVQQNATPTTPPSKVESTSPSTPEAQAKDRDELPRGVEPPTSDDTAPRPNDKNVTAPRDPSSPSAAPQPPAREPHELIHRQKHDLLKPKGW